ncbi:MAG: hypothetical protein CMO55_17255 [Verrucomicrobiales bacterium]|nr:hypothetical protein [Verrucomicrobiales bacterium]
MQSWFSFELDGEPCRVESEDTHLSLASFLSQLDPCFSSFAHHNPWHNSKLIVIGDIENESHRFRVADAGLLMMPMLAGRQVWTPEGIRNVEPDHPVNLALQKGNFESGTEREDALITLMFEGYYRPDLRRQGQISDQFDAINTRTANVPAIRNAAAQVFASTEQLRHEAAQKAERSGQESTVWTGKKDIFGDRFTKRLFQINERTTLNYVDKSKRRFYRPGTLVEMMRLKAEYPSAQIVAGGTGLTRLGKSVEFSNLISLEGVKELNEIITTEDAWEIGSAISLTQIAEKIGRELTSFNKILRRFGSRAIRNRATLGGYLATAWPYGQLAPLLIALNARVILLSQDGERDAPISQFYREDGGTITTPGEIIRSVIIPRANAGILAARGITSRLCDVYCAAPKRTMSQSYATGAFAVELRDKTIVKAWIAYSGIAKSPVRVREVEEALTGKPWTESTVFSILPILNQAVQVEDADASDTLTDYRKQLIVTLFQKFYYQHPTPSSTDPVSLTATGEFAKLSQPFFDSLSS